MSISPSSFTLNSTVFASGTTSANIHSARTYPFPDSQPLSTFLAPPNQSSTPPSSYTSFLPGSRFSRLSEFSSTMPPSGAVGYPYLTRFGIINLSSQLSSSVSSTSDLPGPTADTSTSAGTSLPPSSTFSSNFGVSPSFTSRLTTSGTMLTSSWAILSSPSPSLSANLPSMSGFTSTSMPTSTLPFPITLTTQTSSSPASVSSYSSTRPISSSFPSSPASMSSTPSSTSITTKSPSPGPDSTTTVFISTTVVTSVGPFSSSPPSSPSTSTYTITSVLLGQGGTATDIITSSIALSTESPGSALDSAVPISPGTIAAIALGIVGAFAFSALWLFCARRRHRKLVQEATLVLPVNHAPGPLDDEILDVDELGYGIGSIHSSANPTSQTRPTMGERYAGILAALHLTERFGRGNEGGSTGGVYGSRHDTATDMDGDDDVTRASSPTLPLHVIPSDDPTYSVLLSPPPSVSPPSYHQTIQPTPPPSAYYMNSRRKSSSGPDAAAWFGGYSVAPSSNSHSARSPTLGSGSGSGSVDALMRTRTGSEEPLLGIGKVTSEVTAGVSIPGGVSPTTATDPGSNRLGLGSAFGSPVGSMYSPGSVHPALQYDTSGSYDARTASGSGSYGYARSGTPSSFDVLRSVSSQGALSSAYGHGQSQSQGFRFGFSRPGSSSSGGTGKKAGSGRHSFGVPPTSFRAWKDWGSSASDKEKKGEKQSLKEKEWRERSRSPTSTSNSESMKEKQGRGSPVVGVRALLGRLRRGGHTPSPHSSNKDLPSPTKASMDVDLEKAAADRVTPPPIQIQVATPQRRRFSFILSNPDPHPSSPYSGAGDAVPPSDVSPRQALHPTQHEAPTCDPHKSKPVPFSTGGGQPATTFPTGYVLAPAPSPVHTEESRFTEGLLHPRLRTQGCSDASLRDFEDYSRPIGGVVKNRLYSTTTFGTQDDAETMSPSRGTPVQDVVPGDEHEHENEVLDVFGASALKGVPHNSWFFNDPSQSVTARHSPDRGRDATV